jgi:pimeloyl-ACP methyl ester carboxylesterase
MGRANVKSDEPEPVPFEVVRRVGERDVRLAGETAGDGPPLVLLHGLSATRRNVLQGSRHLLRLGYRLIAYDARGHGESSPAPERRAYEYGDLLGDLAAVLDRFGLERPVLVGSSMGAATAMAWALERPREVAALVQVTPVYRGPPDSPDDQEGWQRSADVLEREGIEAYVELSEPSDVPDRWREVARQATRQRLERHRRLDAVADAMRVVPRSTAFDGMARLDRLDLPTLVVGSRDEADRLHPLSVAQEYAERIPGAELVVEDEGESPLAWQGAQLSRAIARFLERALPDEPPAEPAQT